eukprot:17348-Heterococcus_DN1.PRE.6
MDIEPKLDVRYDLQKTLYDRRHVVYVAAVLLMSELDNANTVHQQTEHANVFKTMSLSVVVCPALVRPGPLMRTARSTLTPVDIRLHTVRRRKLACVVLQRELRSLLTSVSACRAMQRLRRCLPSYTTMYMLTLLHTTVWTSIVDAPKH